MDGSNRAFRVSFSSAGVTKLRDRVNEKLKEFMGDYTDDTLVEYVIVLLRNGRQKEEARKELDVFLGDDSASFVTWLWDHLTSNLDLYAQHRESSASDGIKDSGKHMSQTEGTIANSPDSDYEQDTNGTYRSRHNREWKGLVKDEAKPLLFRSVLVDKVNSTEKPSHQRNARQLPLPRPQILRKRSRHDEEPIKRRVAPRSTLSASCRLLQFAVRDAVRTSQNASSRPEPSSNRLRSVVSASRPDLSMEEQPPRERSGSILPGGMATAVKAAAEAAEDVVKVRSSGNVFDRLVSGSGRSQISGRSLDFEDQMLEDGDYEDFTRDSKYMDYEHMNEYRGELESELQVAGHDAAMVSDFDSESDGLEDFGTSCSDVAVSQVASSAHKANDPSTFQYSVAKDINEAARISKAKDQDPPLVATSNASRKIVNISVNVNTWKPENFNESREVMPEQPSAPTRSGEAAGRLPVQFKDTEPAPSGNKKDVFQQPDILKDAQKPLPSLPGSYSSSQPSDDADSRIIFVSNVHFAATKDTLSRHFNKFGEVLKVIIVTDATTGQPKGSAYVEFLRKESAELALSLNGTSFMSRILKVVKINTSHHDTPAIMSWPRVARVASFASRLGRVPYPRGLMVNAFRARLPLKAGARSMQWKRDTATTSNLSPKCLPSSGPPGNIASPTGRNLTYVRPESKTDSNATNP